MALTNAFYEAVHSGNVSWVRIMMEDSLLIDPTFTEFYEMEKAAASMEGLYDEHDGKELIEDRELWNDEYMDKVMVKVLSNFSHERLEHLKEVVRYLRPVTKQVDFNKEIASSCKNEYSHKNSYQEEKRRCQESGDFRGVKMGAGVVIGGAIGGTVATIAGASTAVVVGSIAAGAVVGGVAVTISINGEKNNE